MGPEDFFALLDEVLREADRDPLDPSGPQRAIVEVRETDRVLQILAGPGSGKTEMLVWRILYELFVLRTPADRLLVTTFTKKAATELEVRLVERADSLVSHAKRRGVEVVDPRVHDVPVGTIHALCDQLMREFDDEYRAAGVRLIDEHEATVRIARVYRFELGYVKAQGNRAPRLVNRLIAREPLTALFRAPWEGDYWPDQRNMDRVAYVRDLLDQHIETWIPRCAADGTANGVEYLADGDGVTDDLIKLQQRWANYLDDENILDFPMVQLRFLERQGVLVNQFDHVFVDEFQDTNPIQYSIHRGWLQSSHSRLTVVGDDDQSIYRFRGSDISCFVALGDQCTRDGIEFRQEVLEENYRSTRSVVAFTERFRDLSALAPVTMEKTLRPSTDAKEGQPVRILIGAWSDLCEIVAEEVHVYVSDRQSRNLPIDVSMLLFSTSENAGRYGSPAGELRAGMETRGIRVNNPRNKTAGRVGSPVHDLIALMSYFFDPVSKERVNGGRLLELHATCSQVDRRPYAKVDPPAYPISTAHASFQKKFRKSDGGTIDRPCRSQQAILDYLDVMRERLADDPKPARLTLAGLVARLLTFPRFRNSGYTIQLFRQALFTNLLEANVAPTRMTTRNLDKPLSAERLANGKIRWPDEYWDLLNVFGGMLEATTLDDDEVEAFADSAVAMLTFHQAKGLEFDHVYVGSTGRNASPSNAIRTAVFSGNHVDYRVESGHPETDDEEMQMWAAADRDREVYVALSRAKHSLTVLYDPDNSRNFMELNRGIERAFDGLPARPYAPGSSVLVKEFSAGVGDQ